MGTCRYPLPVLVALFLSACALPAWVPIRYEPLPPPVILDRPAAAPMPVAGDEAPAVAAPSAPSRPHPAASPPQAKKKPAAAKLPAPNPAAERSSAPPDDPAELYRQGLRALRGEEENEDPLAARQLFLAAAQQGHAEALWTLGLMHEYGLGVPADAGDAAHWYSLAAGQGEVKGMTAFGYLALSGTGIPRHPQAGLFWLRRAAASEDSLAQLLLGIFYDTGWNVGEDDTQALHWYTRAARGGDPLASFLLACQHALAEGAPFDLLKAAQGWRTAARLGLAEAEVVMENRHIHLSDDGARLLWKQNLVAGGFGTARLRREKFSRLVALFKGAALGDKERIFAVGALYWQGEGVARDMDEALRWWRLAARLGEARAQSCLNRLEGFDNVGAQDHGTPPRNETGEWPRDLAYRISRELITNGRSPQAIRPSAVWVDSLRRSRDVSSLP